MLQDVYDMLLSGRLEPRWVEREVHVEVRGRAFAVAGHPRGVTIRKQHAASSAETVADVCTDTAQLLSALGLGRLGKPPTRDADYEKRRCRDRYAVPGPATTVATRQRVENPTATVEPGTSRATEPVTILREVYDRLLLHRTEPRWVDDELYVDVHGRAFAVAECPGGVAVRMQGATVAKVCEDLDEALGALGIPHGQGKTPNKSPR
jgi:hypothetical protein